MGAVLRGAWRRGQLTGTAHGTTPLLRACPLDFSTAVQSRNPHMGAGAVLDQLQIRRPFAYCVALLVGFISSLVATAQAPAGGGANEARTEWVRRRVTDADSPAVAEDDPSDLFALAEESLESLMMEDVVIPNLDTVVTTVARSESTVGKSPAAVYVVSNEMIRRSGARTIPDVLRLVPGVQVARVSGSAWAVSVRGFNGRFSNKLLVQIDGRTAYTPLFSGVYWDVQDLVLEDIDRIEVIRGPGASVWGANAVNGVINIITKRASETQGLYALAGSGTEERGFTTLRYGGALSDTTHYRVYGKWFDRDSGYSQSPPAQDDWRQARAGFRLDSEPSDCTHVTLQGDYYNGSNGDTLRIAEGVPPTFARDRVGDTDVEGANALFRWTHTPTADSEWSLQAYYDRTERRVQASGFAEIRDTIDVDFQHRFLWTQRQDLIWGFGYRNTKDATDDAPAGTRLRPKKRALDTFSYFIQDTITLVPDEWFFVAGAKFQHNDFTQFEFQPTGRLLWTRTERQTIWAAVSRAVRTPSRAESDVLITTQPSAVIPGPPVDTPVIPLLVGSPSFESEDALSFELGARSQQTDRLYWDVAFYYNDYRNLLGLRPGSSSVGTLPNGWPAVFVPFTATNSVSGRSYGAELSLLYELNPQWQVQMNYAYLNIDLKVPTGHRLVNHAGSNPHHMLSAILSGTIYDHIEVDLIGRYVDALPHFGIPAYGVLDARIAANMSHGLQVYVVGRNLFDASHPEFGGTLTGLAATEIQQEVYGGISWRY